MRCFFCQKEIRELYAWNNELHHACDACSQYVRFDAAQKRLDAAFEDDTAASATEVLDVLSALYNELREDDINGQLERHTLLQRAQVLDGAGRFEEALNEYLTLGEKIRKRLPDSGGCLFSQWISVKHFQVLLLSKMNRHSEALCVIDSVLFDDACVVEEAPHSLFTILREYERISKRLGKRIAERYRPIIRKCVEALGFDICDNLANTSMWIAETDKRVREEQYRLLNEFEKPFFEARNKLGVDEMRRVLKNYLKTGPGAYFESLAIDTYNDAIEEAIEDGVASGDDLVGSSK